MLINGARQIGKSTSIDYFITNHFESALTINLATRPDLIDLFVAFKKFDDLLIRLSAVFGYALIPHKTVIFFDEIQLLYQRREELMRKGDVSITDVDLLSLSKPLVQQGLYKCILSGSLLGTELHGVTLNPTGFLDVVQMFPLDFEEYLWAKGVSENVNSYLRKCFEGQEKVDEPINKMFLSHFREYVLIGGFPEAVDAYLKTQNLYSVSQIHRNKIIGQYTQDITKYVNDGEKKLKIREVYDAIPSEINSKNKRFTMSHVFTKSELKDELSRMEEHLWLNNAGITIPVHNVTNPIPPLSLSLQRKTLKLFIKDIGLLVTMLMETGLREKLLLNEKVINFGAPYENVVAQELYAHGFKDKIYYYNSKKAR